MIAARAAVVRAAAGVAWGHRAPGASAPMSGRGPHRSASRVLTSALAVGGLTLLGLALGGVTGCASGDPPPEPPPKTAEDLFREAEESLAGQRALFFFESVDYPKAIAQFEAIIESYPFSEFSTLSELKIADAYFDQRRYQEAASFYQEFVELHPTHPKVPYALLRNGECAFEQMLAPDQDQGKTRDALGQFEALMARFPEAEEIPRAKELRAEAIDQLATHEVVVGDFYFGTDKYHAAVPRYREALERSPEHPGFRRTKVRLGIALRRSGEAAEGDQILQAVLPDPALDDESRELGEEELGYAVAVQSSGEESGGWWLWPF